MKRMAFDYALGHGENCSTECAFLPPICLSEAERADGGVACNAKRPAMDYDEEKRADDDNKQAK